MKQRKRLKENATPDRLEKLKRLRAERNELIFKAYISPASMMLGLLAGQLFLVRSKWMNGSGFAPAPITDVSKTTKQISVIRINYLAELMKMQKAALDEFTTFSNNLPLDEKIKKELKKEIYKNNPFNSIYMYVDKISKYSPKAVEDIKTSYVNMFVKLAAFSGDVLFKKYFSSPLSIHAIDIDDMINQGPLLQEIQKQPLIDIVALLKSAYDDFQENTLLKPENLQSALDATNLISSLYAFGGAVFLILILLGFVLLTYTVEHTMHFGYKKWNQKNIVDAESIEKEIALIETQIKTLQVHANRVNTSRYAFLAILLLIGMYNAQEQGPESFAVYFLILNNLIHFFSESSTFSIKRFSDWCRNRKINNLTDQFDRAVKCTGVSWEFVKGESSVLDSLRFKTVVSHILSTSMINQIVKNVLFKNGIHIISYEKNSFTVKPVSLNAKTINAINQKIEKEIERYQAIKKISQRINAVLKTEYVKHILTDESDLPTAVYQISLRNININLESIKEIFSGCELEQNGSYLFIKGHQLIKQECQLSSVSAVISDEKNPNPNEFLVTSNAGVTRKKQIKKQNNDVKPKDVKNDEKTEPHERIEFPCGAVYDSRDPHCEVKKVNHPIFGKNHFILFRIPESAFASPADCIAVRNKIHEAEFATSAKDSQGLQFRHEVGRDLTAPHARMFSSDLRSKHMGARLGDIRPVAETERSAQNPMKQLHVFKGINNH